jgi:hypothetical protein
MDLNPSPHAIHLTVYRDFTHSLQLTEHSAAGDPFYARIQALQSSSIGLCRPNCFLFKSTVKGCSSRLLLAITSIRFQVYLVLSDHILFAWIIITNSSWAINDVTIFAAVNSVLSKLLLPYLVRTNICYTEIIQGFNLYPNHFLLSVFFRKYVYKYVHISAFPHHHVTARPQAVNQGHVLRIQQQVPIYWRSTRGQPTVGDPPICGLEGGGETPHSKIKCMLQNGA